VLLCLVAGAAGPWGVVAARLHPALRLAYIAVYVGNVPAVRGLCWAGGLACSGLLYVEGLKAVLAAQG
jgi:uncharacterized MAPEG superfamily protein